MSLRRTWLFTYAALLVVGVLVTIAWSTPAAQAQGGGSVGGGVYWIDQYGNLRPMPWALVTAVGGGSEVSTYTTDGSFYIWLPPGTYDVTASSSPGFAPDTKANVAVSDGSSTSIEFVLTQTGVPVPELPAWSQPLVVISTLAIATVAVRRRTAGAKA